VNLEAYLFFPGNTEEAMNFYQSVLGGDLSITRRGDVDPTAPKEEAHRSSTRRLDTGSFTMRAARPFRRDRRGPDQDRTHRYRRRRERPA